MKTTYLNKFIIFIASLAILSSCTEVVEIPLEDTDRRTTVQANLYDVEGLSQVTLFQSGSYYEPGEYPALTGASVSISDQQGNSFELEENQAGIYGLANLKGEAGNTYTLTIDHEGEKYIATTQMLPRVEIDSVTFEDSPGNPNFGIEAGKVLQVHFAPDNLDNTYLRFRLVVNDTLQNNLFLYSSDLPRGGAGQYVFITSIFQPGDRIQVITESLPKDVFTYFDQLSELTGDAFGPPSAAPANPEGNLSNDALGYFAAVAASLRVVIVP